MRKSCKIVGSEEGMELLYQHTLRKQAEKLQEQETRALKDQLAIQERQIAMLTAQLSQPALAPVESKVAAHAINTVNTGPQTIANMNTGVQQVFNISIFGKESTGHIDRAGIKALLDHTIAQIQDPSQGAMAALLRTAALIYSDPARPENLTCYLPNKKKEDVMVHGESGWEIQSCQLVLPPMVTKSVDALFDNQPFEDAAKYGDLMKALRENEQAYMEGKEMKTILVRNKALLEKVLGTLPK